MSGMDAFQRFLDALPDDWEQQLAKNDNPLQTLSQGITHFTNFIKSSHSGYIEAGFSPAESLHLCIALQSDIVKAIVDFIKFAYNEYKESPPT